MIRCDNLTRAFEGDGVFDISLQVQAGQTLGLLGPTGAGKSVTTGALLLPGVVNRREVVFYVDGGTGASAGHLAGAMDWWAVTEEEWVAAIECAYAVLKDRKARRGAMGLSAWRGAAERRQRGEN